VTTRNLGNGTTRISAIVKQEHAAAVQSSLAAAAASARAAGDPRSSGQVKADTVVERITGLDTAETTPVAANLVVGAETLFGECDEPGTIPGSGPIPAAFCRELVLYPSAAARASLRRLFWEDGETSFDNGQGLCETCNYVKETPGWISLGGLRPRPAVGRDAHAVPPRLHLAGPGSGSTSPADGLFVSLMVFLQDATPKPDASEQHAPEPPGNTRSQRIAARLRTRTGLAAGGAALLLLVGGGGFAIGHAVAGDGHDRDHGRYGPMFDRGEGRPDRGQFPPPGAPGVDPTPPALPQEPSSPEDSSTDGSSGDAS
jgi:hypothetical protein